jgi:alpha-L-fucosidase
VTGAGESARQEISANGFALLKHGDPDGEFWLPAMSDAPLRGHGGHEWFWEPGDERLIYPLDKLVDIVCRSVGHNSTLILGLTPDDRGLLPDADVERLAELGAALERMFSQPVAQLERPLRGTSVRLNLDSDATFDTVVLQEQIEHGERVRAYVLEVLRDGEWQRIAEGTCIGHKRIQRFPEACSGDAVRLRVTDSRGEPHLRSFAVYDAAGAESAQAP